ncbi:MASE3 domain-containing protein [Azospirillum brasilense]|uniref:MASE3 domain-containing protein n=1 Tax=Azospirillum brasilense TaxID=192 RepID=UPI000E6A7A93|nr:MASE3 domain-containing protein [Azospirillum brasilense]NUB25830.1 PAS domain S-box protein [Azospirillum brasilense]NUB33371.1 PAS domain S-box protein [Azospirillum brasilense]RIV99883.1 PAS domain S-box protein [Azospirillum brasilense]
MSGTQPSAIRSTFTRWLRDRSFLSGLTALLILMAVLGTVMRHNYLLFHLCAELFAVAVAMTIFTIAWNTRDTNQSPFLAFVGLSMPGIALLDLLHAIAFPGMNVIGEAGANQSTQLWIAARGLQAAVFLAAPLLTEKRLRTGDVLLIQAAVVACTLLSIFTFDIMPDSFVPDVGLTPFKVSAEYAFSAAAVVACLLLCRKRRQFEPKVFGLTFAGIALLAPQELIFTLYTDPHGAMNALGHFIKILSFYLLYRAIIVTALQNPYDLAFYRMRRSEEALRDHLSGLESLIATRTAELRESEARWRALLECSNDWFWETDERGRFTALSPRAQESTGRGGAELLGFTHADLLDRNRPEEDFPALTEALHRREPFRRLSFPLASPGGSARWVMVSGTPRYDGNGAFLGYRGTTSDISARRQSAEAARQKQTMAALGSLVGGLAHEINNLLQPVISLSDLARGRAGEDRKLHTYLNAIHDSGVKARTIMRDVLQFARVEVAESPPGNLEEAVHSALELAAPSMPASVETLARLEPGLKAVTITATELTQVLLNLIQNARDAMPQGGTLTIGARSLLLRERDASRRQLGEGDYVRLTVADTGTGMDEATRQRVFDPFFTTKPVGTGTGLGLSVVYGIVRNGGGDILVESAPGRGTSFIIDLPTALTGGPGQTTHGMLVHGEGAGR